MNNKIKIFELDVQSLKKQLCIPGISCTVVRNQEIIWTKGIGYADIRNQRLATPQTTYSLASITKTFASIVLLQLVENNILELDTPISGFGIKLNGTNEVTVRHLLSHTSRGIPGSQFCYSERRFFYLEQIMNAITGYSFSKLVIDKVIKPLNLSSTAPCIMKGNPSFLKAFEKLAKPYVFDSTNKIEETSSPSFFSVTGGLISSVEDMSIYCNALNNNMLLSPSMKAIAWNNCLSNDGQKLPYGLGWFVQDFEGHHIVWHHGRECGFSSLIIKIPDENISLVLLANNEELSYSFPLSKGDIMVSPFAIAFLKVFTPQYIQLCNTIIDWDGSEETLKQQMIKIADSEERELLLKDIIAHYFINLRFNQSNSKKMFAIASILFPDKNIRVYI